MLFSYNILNLPCEVTAAAGAGGGSSGSLTYTYLSDGTKVSAIKSDGSGKRYLGSAVYSVPESDGGSETLESVAWDEGRIGFTKSGSTYTLTDLWFVKDHLGNVRSVIDVSPGLSSPQVVERNMESDDIGNFHFGVVTKAYGKIPEEMGLIGAGLVQILSGTSSMRFINCTYTRFPMGVGGLLEIKRPYGDDPKDQEQILRGYEYYKKKQ